MRRLCPMRIVQCGDSSEPGSDGRGILDAILGVHAITDRNRHAAEIFHSRERVLIGEIVADEHRCPARKRRLSHECLDRSVLGETARLDLQHHAAFLDVIVAAQLQCDGGHCIANARFELGRHAKMHGDGSALVLEQGARVSLHPRGEHRARRGELRIHEARPVHGTRCLAPLDSVQARGGQAQRREQRIEILDAAAAHQCDRAPQAFCHLTQQRLETVVCAGFKRRIGQLDQSAVNVQEQAPCKQRRRHRLYHDAKLTGCSPAMRRANEARAFARAFASVQLNFQCNFYTRSLRKNRHCRTEFLYFVPMFRSVMLRFVLPVAFASCVVAYFGLPYIERLLAEWFRSDVELRAQLVMHSMEEPITDLVEKGNESRLRAYLAKTAADERLLAILVCRPNGSTIFRSERTPASISCDATDGPKPAASHVVQLPSGSVQVSRFDFDSAQPMPFRVLMLHDLSFVDRRQRTARDFVLVFVGISVLLLALLVVLVAWLQLRRWVEVLIGDIRGKRYLDDAESPRASMPILSQVRKVLAEAEEKQRLEIDFHEYWTPQALRQVVRDHLHSAQVIIVANREPYIHNYDADQRPVMQVPASGMVTALEPIMRACAGTWIAH